MSFRSSSPTGSFDEGQGRASSSSRRNGNNRTSLHEEETDYTTGIARTKKQNDTSPVVEKALAAFGANQPRKAGGNADGSGSSRNRSAAASGAATPTASGGNDAAGAARSRRGAVGVQGESARARAASALEKVPSTPAFREMERVLAQVATEWPELLPPEAAVQNNDAGASDADAEGLGEDAFDPVTLALSLVEPDAPQERFRSFLATKDALSRSLKSSIQTHYHSFDASVSSYNGLLANLTAAQRNTSALRSRLEEVRETLGKNRTELGVLEARRTELNEMDRILIAIESLKSVPDRLETLVSEKRFLNAAVLLMRSLKMINKQDLMEVAAVADLRAYFVSQEAVRACASAPISYCPKTDQSVARSSSAHARVFDGRVAQSPISEILLHRYAVEGTRARTDGM